MERFKWIISLLEENNIQYWADDGTLLGLIRDGQPLDGDIDLAVWYENKNQIQKLNGQIIEQGYSRLAKSYRGHPFGYFYISDSEPNIDFHFYKMDKSHAWCITFMPDKKTRQKLKSITNIHKGFSTFFYFLYHKHIKKQINVPTRPVNFFKIGTRWVPKKYYQSFIEKKFNGFSVTVPEKYDEYLTLKYGDWQTRVDDWSYFHDDGARKPVLPEELVQNEIF